MVIIAKIIWPAHAILFGYGSNGSYNCNFAECAVRRKCTHRTKVPRISTIIHHSLSSVKLILHTYKTIYCRSHKSMIRDCQNALNYILVEVTQLTFLHYCKTLGNNLLFLVRNQMNVLWHQVRTNEFKFEANDILIQLTVTTFKVHFQIFCSW